MKLNLLSGEWIVAKLATQQDVERTLANMSPPLFQLMRDSYGWTLVCEARCEEQLTGVVDIERNWRCLQVAGVLDFSLVGILSQLTTALSRR